MTEFDAVMVDAMLEAGAKLETWGSAVERDAAGQFSTRADVAPSSIRCYFGRRSSETDALIGRVYDKGLHGSLLDTFPVHRGGFEDIGAARRPRIDCGYSPQVRHVDV